MKRVQIPKDVQCSFIHSLPEAATPALAANFIVSNGHSVVILVDENTLEGQIIYTVTADDYDDNNDG